MKERKTDREKERKKKERMNERKKEWTNEKKKKRKKEKEKWKMKNNFANILTIREARLNVNLSTICLQAMLEAKLEQ